MNKKRAALLLLACLTVPLLTGCFDSKELNQLSVALAMGIDTVDGDYMVSVQLVDPSQMSKNKVPNRSPTTVHAETCSTVFECVRKMTTKTSREIYFSHLQMLIFDEETARKGIKESLDVLFRDPEIRPDFQLAVVKNRQAKDVLEFVTATELLPALEMYKSLKVSEKLWAPTSSVNVLELLRGFELDGINPVITGMTLSGDLKKGKSIENVKQPHVPANFHYTGIGMFRADRLVGWMNEDESKAYTYIMNRVSSTAGLVNCPHSDKKFIAEVTQSKVKIKAHVVEGKPKGTLHAIVTANIGEMECDVNLSDEKVFLELQEHVSYELKDILERGVRKAQKYKADIFGFGEAFHRKYPKQWRQWKYDWEERFSELPVEIKVDYKLVKMGHIISPVEPDSKSEG